MKSEEFKKNKDTILAIIGIIFLVGLAILARAGGGNQNDSLEPTPSTTQNPTDETTTEPESTDILESLNQKNYHFTYTIQQNNETEIIDGKVNGSKAVFTILGNQKEEYAKVSDNYLKKENGEYKIISSEIRAYFSYINNSALSEILEISMMEEKDNIQTYSIDTTDLLDEYTDIEYDGFDDFKDDTIKIYKNKEQQIEKIELDYSNYFSYVNEQATTFKVTMEFSDYGNIEEIEL